MVGPVCFGGLGRERCFPEDKGALAHWPYSVFHFPWWTQGNPGYLSSEKGKDSFFCCHHSRRNQKLEYHCENLLGRSSLPAEVPKGPRARAVDKVNTWRKLEGIRGGGKLALNFLGTVQNSLPPIYEPGFSAHICHHCRPSKSHLCLAIFPFHRMISGLTYLLSFIFSRLLLNLNSIRTPTESRKVVRKANYWLWGTLGQKENIVTTLLFLISFPFCSGRKLLPPPPTPEIVFLDVILMNINDPGRGCVPSSLTFNEHSIVCHSHAPINWTRRILSGSLSNGPPRQSELTLHGLHGFILLKKIDFALQEIKTVLWPDLTDQDTIISDPLACKTAFMIIEIIAGPWF